jgi:hypothetical protein
MWSRPHRACSARAGTIDAYTTSMSGLARFNWSTMAGRPRSTGMLAPPSSSPIIIPTAAVAWRGERAPTLVSLAYGLRADER